MEGKPERISWFNLADHQVEYIISLCHCFFLRIKISCSTTLQQYIHEICILENNAAYGITFTMQNTILTRGVLFLIPRITFTFSEVLFIKGPSLYLLYGLDMHKSIESLSCSSIHNSASMQVMKFYPQNC